MAQQSFIATKNLYGKANGTFFYQYVQSFPPQEALTPSEAHKIALELAERFFPGCEVLVATHIDAEHLHSHFVVNSVHPDTGKKLHFTPRTLEQMRTVSDQICLEHGLSTLRPYQQEWQTKGMRAVEYRAAAQGQSWKFQLTATVEAVMAQTGSQEEFIREMERRGYGVRWEDGRKSITYTIPRIGNIKLKKLTSRDLQKLYKDLMEHGRINTKSGHGNPGLSSTTVRSVHLMLHCAFERAVKEKLIPRNPTDDCIAPKVKKVEMKILAPEHIKSYLDAA